MELSPRDTAKEAMNKTMASPFIVKKGNATMTAKA
jgi:hypothetical protein